MFVLMICIVSLSSALAGTCTDGSVPTGRVYADQLSRLQVDGDGYIIFKYKVGTTESGWLTFFAADDIGKQYYAMLLAAGTSHGKFSFYVTSGVCHGSTLKVNKFSMQW